MELSISRESPTLNATKVRLPESGGAASNQSTGRGMVGDQELSEVDYESLPTDRLSAHLLAGGAAGIMEHCVMYPVDCVKTRMMALVPNPHAHYRSVLGAFSTIAATEKPRALFKGIGVVAMGAGPAHAIYFSTYEYSKKLFSRYSNGVVAQGAAGAIASLIHDGFMNPVEVIKQRLQCYGTPYKSALHCARLVYQREGLRAFYRSYTTQLSMNVPFQVIHFVSYEFLQDMLNPSRNYHPLSHMLSGAGAGAFAAAATTPLDVAKTLLNTHEQSKHLGHDKRIQGVVNAMARIYQTTGYRGYFKGLSARVIYQMPSTALCWSVYEFFKYTLGLKEVEAEEIAARANKPSP